MTGPAHHDRRMATTRWPAFFSQPSLPAVPPSCGSPVRNLHVTRQQGQRRLVRRGRRVVTEVCNRGAVVPTEGRQHLSDINVKSGPGRI